MASRSVSAPLSTRSGSSEVVVWQCAEAKYVTRHSTRGQTVLLRAFAARERPFATDISVHHALPMSILLFTFLFVSAVRLNASL